MDEQQKLNQLNQEYNSIEIPNELEDIINKVFEQNKQEQFKTKRRFDNMKTWQKGSIAAALTFSVFVGGLNISSTFANTLLDIPVIGTLAKVFTFRDYKVSKDGFEADIKIPNVEGLDNKELENQLNEEFIKEGQKLYEEFIKEMEEIQKEGEGHLAVKADYETKTDNDKVLSIVLTEFTAMGSSDTKFKTYNVDKINQAIITLPSLFKNDRYIEVISENIKEQMRSEMAKDDSKIYDVDLVDEPIEGFKQIKPDQNFYIDNEGKLVILFDKYEVAPGFMGTPQFTIPTNIIQDLLLDRNLIK